MSLEKRANEVGSGRVLLFGLIALILLFPIGYYLVAGIATAGEKGTATFLEIPDGDGDACVRETEYMRNHHWQLLRGVREEVVRYGNRKGPGLSRCRECHVSRERFCDQCHHAAGLEPDCWACHNYP